MPKIVSNENREIVARLSGLGLTHIQIASVLGISRTTLYKHYKQELDTGKAFCISKVAENLYKMATGDTTSRNTLGACIFYLKTQAGWKEVNTIEVLNANEDREQFGNLLQEIRESKLREEKEPNSIN
jgi:DNA invertase Pin-like site-specific DNA recombinase